MKSILKKIKVFILAHKKISTIIVICLVAGAYGIYNYYGNSTAQTLYVLAKAEKGEIVNTVNGTGQVSALNQVDVTSKNSGDIVYLKATVGQEVKEGDLIAQIDYGNALYELETAKLSYEKLVNVDPDDIQNAKDDVLKAGEDLTDAYVSGRSNLISASTEMSDVLVGVDELFEGYLDITSNASLNTTAKNYVNRAKDSYNAANNLLKDFLKEYRTITKDTPESDVEIILSKSYEVSVAISGVAKDAQDAVVYLRDRENDQGVAAEAAYEAVTLLVSDANAITTNLLGSKNQIISVKRSLVDSQNTLSDLVDGPDSLDIRSEALSLKQKQDAYLDYFIKAPFDGVIAAINYHKGDNVKSGASIVTLITKQKIAEISLNEIDAAKVIVGQSAILTFDALEDVEISGQVAEVDLVGTVSQGVVNYSVKISFDAENNTIKTGMTVNADIVTEKKENVIRVPISAVTELKNKSFVSVVTGHIFSEPKQKNIGVPLNTVPNRIEVQTGISNDEYVEIKSGLNEGDIYVVKTTVSDGTVASASAKTSSGIFGGSTGSRPQFPR